MTFYEKIAAHFAYFAIAFLILVALSILAPDALGKQMQPDAKRIAQIQKALVDHGYESGKTWPQTQEILRTIAQDRQWQVKHAPDARVLILLGLGNEFSNLWVVAQPGGHLDGNGREP